MSPAVKEVADLLGKLLGLYQKALQLGSAIPNLAPEAIVDILDQRGRILVQTTELQAKAKHLETQLQKKGLSPSENAFLTEQKTRLKELKPRFLEQERRVNIFLKSQMNNIRSEMVSHNRSADAIRQYLLAPQSKPYV